MYQNPPKKNIIQILSNSPMNISFENTKWINSQNYFDLIDYTFNNIIFHWKYTPKWHTQNVRGKIKHIYIEHGCYFLTVLFMKNYFKIIAIKFSLHISYHYFSKYYNFRGITDLPPYTLMMMCRREKRGKKREEEECGEKEHKWKKSFGSWWITIIHSL